MTQVPTTDQIRNAIDSGATGEKVAFPDPAAAPLGTDAEAGGNTPTRAERAMEAQARIEQPPRVPPNGVAIYLAAIAAVGAMIVLMSVIH
ncbi:MAG: hypothetical protein KME20_27635 [Kaiparowitsia implicata GSE-PSE-MK54-09C]|nr:hypothetical protein [Kaiparowitsia implicata GSE-PSE-MK54-09C]